MCKMEGSQEIKIQFAAIVGAKICYSIEGNELISWVFIDLLPFSSPLIHT